MKWNKDVDNMGLDCIYIEIEADGFTYELGVFCASSYSDCEYYWCMETTELFEEFDSRYNVVTTTLASGHVMTIEDGKEAAIKAYHNRQQYREDCIYVLSMA